MYVYPSRVKVVKRTRIRMGTIGACKVNAENKAELKTATNVFHNTREIEREEDVRSREREREREREIFMYL